MGSDGAKCNSTQQRALLAVEGTRVGENGPSSPVDESEEIAERKFFGNDGTSTRSKGQGEGAAGSGDRKLTRGSIGRSSIRSQQAQKTVLKMLGKSINKNSI